jgi:hypothetical protein
MNKAAVTTGIMTLLCLAGLGGSSPVQPVPARPSSRDPGTSLLETHTFKAKERACVIGVGQAGATFLGLYIYDEHGNCVTWDDIGTSSTKDDVAVEWFPTQTAPYTIEVRNFGMAANKLELAVR